MKTHRLLPPMVGVTAFILSALAAGRAEAHGEGVLIQKSGGHLVVGFDDDTPGGQQLGARVFSATLPSNGLTQDPSFLSVSPAPSGLEPLPVGESVYWDFLPLTAQGVTSNLMYWSGAGDLGFSAATQATLKLYDPNFVPATVDGTPSATPGERIGTITSDALALHAHRYWELAGGAAAAEPGVYVASLRLRMEGLVSTEPIYVALSAFGTPVSALDEAVSWLNGSLDSLLLRGDYNFNGVVDSADYGLWTQQYGATTPQPVNLGEADGNGDGVINAADYTVWRDHRGPGGVTASAAQAAPEPGAFGMAACLLATLSFRVAACRLTTTGA